MVAIKVKTPQSVLRTASSPFRGAFTSPFFFVVESLWTRHAVSLKIARAVTKTIVQKRNDSEKLSPKRLLQLSAAGEVFLEGEQPSESPSADGETLCAMLLAHGEGG